jgi:succinate dehydrogenase/fumarate reductase-like Fe-S protein
LDGEDVRVPELACPKGLNPAKAIAEVKKMMVARQY